MRLKDYVVPIDMPLVEIMKSIDQNAQGIVYVCDQEMTLLGVITDGDVRRAIIRTGKLNAIAGEIMKTDPITVSEPLRSHAVAVMHDHSIRSVPVIDERRVLKDIKFIDEKVFFCRQKVDAPVVIMAGGKGTRLHPYTNILPKPLIPIGDKTITEHIIERFARSGCHRFDMIVNYKRNLIKAFFKDSESDIKIRFFEEERYLGTAGGLRLLRGCYNEPFFMTNCDILIEEEYAKIMDYHKSRGNLATIVCALKDTKLPYGVINAGEDGRIQDIKEKPSISAMVNTGLYILEPDFIERIPKDEISQITDVFQECINAGEKIGLFPVSDDHWMDMGQMDELQMMMEKFEVI